LDKRSGRILSFRLRPDLLSGFLNVPESGQEKTAHEVLQLPDSAIFTIQETRRTP
jgi:hypothetical protein